MSPTHVSYLGGRVSVAWSSASAKSCTLSASPRFFSLVKPKRVKCSGGLSRTVHSASLAAHWTFTLRARSAAGRVAVVKRTLVLRAPPFLVSANWAGYIVPSAPPVTEVSGQFTVPTLDCH